MKVTIVIFCLMGAVVANPILYNVALEPSGLEANMTLSFSVSQSSESDTSELQSSEENTSNQSSESESSESTSEDKTSEESDSQSFEDRTSSMEETRDNSMASEENIRKGWISVFANVVRALSEEDNSTEADLALVDSPDNSQSTETSQASQSSESTSSESSETSETSDSRDTSESTESDSSDSADMDQIKADCQQGVNGTSCESDEYFFQDIGDDGFSPVDLLMMPEEEHNMEFSIRR